MKDRVEVQPERDPNYIQAADGHLIIIQAREKDRGNYTCVAENVANHRLSPPARLSVVGKLQITRSLYNTTFIEDCGIYLYHFKMISYDIDFTLYHLSSL